MQEYKFVALGDSITCAYPFTPQESWVEILRQRTGWKVINAGISGDTLGDMAERLNRDVLIHNPQVVMLLGGANDVFQGMSQPQMEQSFLKIWENISEKGIDVWIGLPLPVYDYFERKLSVWRNWLINFSQQKKLIVVDFYQDFVAEEGRIRSELLVDDCHPTIQGYKIMGQRILKLIT